MTCVFGESKSRCHSQSGCRQLDRVGTASSNRPKIEVEVAERLCQDRRGGVMQKAVTSNAALLSGLRCKSAPEQVQLPEPKFEQVPQSLGAVCPINLLSVCIRATVIRNAKFIYPQCVLAGDAGTDLNLDTKIVGREMQRS